MELGPNVFDDILMPSSAFSVIEASIASRGQRTDDPPWLESSINPINMLDRLPLPSQAATWRIDGGEGHIGRLFAMPGFAVSGTILRIDLFLPPLQSIRDTIQDVLQLKTLFGTRSSDTSHHTVARYLVAGLEHWTSLNPGFQQQYKGMPFGSQLVVTNLGTGIASMRCELRPNYALEAQMLSISRLNAAWQLPPNSWPTVLDVADLELVKQAHESISLVRLRKKGDGRLYVFKSNIEDPKYLYHELRVLLTMSSHPNIVERPVFLVTKRCRFGGKVGVCGFILPYYSGDSLRYRLRKEASGYVWTLKDKLRCAIQITSTIRHVAQQPLNFYSDLKIDNVVFTSDTADAEAILIDFEQRGASYVWEPPEIFSIDILDWVASFGREQQAVERCQTLLRRCLYGWEPRTKAIDLRTARPYNTPWLALNEAEREKAQVFMLGKVL